MAGLALLTRTELLLIVLGGLYVAVTGSVVLQVSWFKLTRRTTGVGKRIFRMAPLQHHFAARLGAGDRGDPLLDHHRSMRRGCVGDLLQRLGGEPTLNRCLDSGSSFTATQRRCGSGICTAGRGLLEA